MPTTHQVQPGSKIKLRELTTRGKELHNDRREAEREFHDLREEFAELQNRFYADGRHKLLIVLQATDAGGKDSTIRKVFKGVNPQGVRVTSFKKPTDEELDHDFLWRVHKAVPGKGMIGVFNRSHYEDVLVVRVHNFVAEDVWRPRYEQINEFERLLSTTGTKILKFYLHISKEEQAERFQDRVDNPEKHWKFNHEDLEKRKFWDAYQEAFEDMLNECSTEHAPWYVIPSDQKWYRNLAISRAIVHTLRDVNPQYPEAEEGISDVVVE